MFEMNLDPELQSIPPSEYRPPSHPDVIFRTHSDLGRFSILHLGGEEYWMEGTWLALSAGQMVMVRDRVFRVSELAQCDPGIELPLPLEHGAIGLS